MDIDALSTDADDGAIGYVPVLARPPIARDVYDRGTLSGSAALHVETKSTHAHDVSVIECPLLVLPRVTLLDVDRRARHWIPVVLDIHALIGTAAGDLMRRGAGKQRDHQYDVGSQQTCG